MAVLPFFSASIPSCSDSPKRPGCRASFVWVSISKSPSLLKIAIPLCDRFGIFEDAEVLKKPRTHNFHNIESFKNYIQAYGNPSSGAIFYNKHKIEMVFEENSRAESVDFSWVLSDEIKVFLGEGGKRRFDQKTLIKTLKCFSENVSDKAIWQKLSVIRFDKQVNLISDITPHNFIFHFEEKDGKQTQQIPTEFTLTAPYFQLP